MTSNSSSHYPATFPSYPSSTRQPPAHRIPIPASHYNSPQSSATGSCVESVHQSGQSEDQRWTAHMNNLLKRKKTVYKMIHEISSARTQDIARGMANDVNIEDADPHKVYSIFDYEETEGKDPVSFDHVDDRRQAAQALAYSAIPALESLILDRTDARSLQQVTDSLRYWRTRIELTREAVPLSASESNLVTLIKVPEIPDWATHYASGGVSGASASGFSAPIGGSRRRPGLPPRPSPSVITRGLPSQTTTANPKQYSTPASAGGFSSTPSSSPIGPLPNPYSPTSPSSLSNQTGASTSPGSATTQYSYLPNPHSPATTSQGGRPSAPSGSTTSQQQWRGW